MDGYIRVNALDIDGTMQVTYIRIASIVAVQASPVASKFESRILVDVPEIAGFCVRETVAAIIALMEKA